MVVEFIGAPGAGKTTLLSAAIACLSEQGYRVSGVAEAARPFIRRTLPGALVARFAPRSLRAALLWQIFVQVSALYRLGFLANHLALLRLVFESQIRRPRAANSRQRRVLHWWLRTAGYHSLLTALAQPGEVLVFDEGFTHRVVQLFASGAEKPDPALIVAYLNQLPRPDLVIAVQAPHEVCLQRVLQRGVWAHARSQSLDELAQFVAHAHHASQIAVDHLVSSGWAVIEFDNGAGDPARARAALHESLQAIPAFSPPAWALAVTGR
jgi:hypothetical protein